MSKVLSKQSRMSSSVYYYCSSRDRKWKSISFLTMRASAFLSSYTTIPTCLSASQHFSWGPLRCTVAHFTVLSLWNPSKAITKAVSAGENSSSTTSSQHQLSPSAFCVFLSTHIEDKDRQLLLINGQQKFPFPSKIAHMHPSEPLEDLDKGGGGRRGQANMAQLCTIAVWTNREMTQLKPESHGPGHTSLVCLLWVTEFTCFATTSEPVPPAVGIRVPDWSARSLKSCLIRAVSLFACGRFQSDGILYMFGRRCVRAVCFSLVPSLFWCAFLGCSLPRPDKLAAVWRWRADKVNGDLFWHVFQRLSSLNALKE